MKTTKPTHVSELVPFGAQYRFDESTSLARVTIETQRAGEPVAYATVTARLSVGVYGTDETPEYGIDAEYVSHDGECRDDQIEYALRVIETNN